MFAGLRVSELRHLKRSWVNLEEGTITVPTRQYCNCPECKAKRDGVWRPKTRKGARTILIHPTLLPVMSEFLAKQDGLNLTSYDLQRSRNRLPSGSDGRYEDHCLSDGSHSCHSF